MKTKSILALALIALLAVSCAPKKTEAPAAAPAAAEAVAPADIKDVATWTASYDALLVKYTEVAGKLNSGDPSVLKTGEELVATATALDTVAETIKGTLTGQAQTDFAATMQTYKDKMKVAAGG